MPSIRLPVVEAWEPLGRVAQITSEAGVGAALVRDGADLSLLHMDELPSDPTITARSAALDIGNTIPRFGLNEALRGDGSMGVTAELGGFADLQLGEDHLARINAPVGFKQCSVDADHTYPPSFPKSNCPRQDGGKLTLKYF